MNNTATTFDWFSKQEKTLGEVPCQNCGKMVTVLLPFIGCVFCGDCSQADSGWNDGTEDFYDKRRGKWASLEIKCPEYRKEKPDDDRVRNGLKCAECAYGG